MSNTMEFRGKKMNSAAIFHGNIPQQKPKFCGSAQNSAVHGKLWALLITQVYRFKPLLRGT